MFGDPWGKPAGPYSTFHSVSVPPAIQERSAVVIPMLETLNESGFGQLFPVVNETGPIHILESPTPQLLCTYASYEEDAFNPDRVNEVVFDVSINTKPIGNPTGPY